MSIFQIIIVALILGAVSFGVWFYKRAERIRKKSYEDYLKQKEERQKQIIAETSRNFSSRPYAREYISPTPKKQEERKKVSYSDDEYKRQTSSYQDNSVDFVPSFLTSDSESYSSSSDSNSFSFGGGDFGGGGSGSSYDDSSSSSSSSSSDSWSSSSDSSSYDSGSSSDSSSSSWD